MPEKDEYPPCPNRIDTEEVENTMRGVIKKRIHSAEQENITRACDKIFDECITKLARVLYLMQQVRDGLWPKDRD